VGLAAAAVPATADDLSIAHDHAADHRVWFCAAVAAKGQARSGEQESTRCGLSRHG
jgi:hypothetical protein